MLKDVIGQSIFQLGVMYLLVFHGDAIFNTTPGYLAEGPSTHYTMVFNAFVMLQLFNQVNARKIHDESDIMDGILDNKLFLGILGSEFLLQVGTPGLTPADSFVMDLRVRWQGHKCGWR